MVKIAYFHLKDAKGIVDVEWEPAADGITVLGGKSGQGKTCILDLIAWALGGDKYRPDKANRDGAAGFPDLHVALDNGLIVTRKGKRSTLKVTDADKALGNQGLLNKFIGTFALDAPKFLRLSPKEKAEALLNIIGVGDELRRLDKLHEDLYAEREAHGRVTIQKEKYAAELPIHKDTPAEETSVSAIVHQIQAISEENAQNAIERQAVSSLADRCSGHANGVRQLAKGFKEDNAQRMRNIEELERQLKEAREAALKCKSDNDEFLAGEEDIQHEYASEHQKAKDAASVLTDHSTDALQQQLDTAEETNAKVRANKEKTSADNEGKRLRSTYIELTNRVEQVRAARIALLDGADLPLPGLGIEAGELTYEDLPWDSMSTSDQMKVAAAISARERPECEFLLADGLETMDVETLADFNTWVEEQKLQLIGTRVSTGSECSLIIQEGKIAETK